MAAERGMEVGGEGARVDRDSAELGEQRRRLAKEAGY